MTSTEVWVQRQQRENSVTHSISLLPCPYGYQKNVMHLGTKSNASSDNMSNAVSVISSLPLTRPMIPNKTVQRKRHRGCLIFCSLTAYQKCNSDHLCFRFQQPNHRVMKKECDPTIKPMSIQLQKSCA